MNIKTTLHYTVFFACISFATVLPVFGDPGSDEFPVYNASKEAFRKYSKPLDEERVEKLKALGYDNEFRVISFDSICEGLEKKAEDFGAGIKDYKKTFADWIKAVPCSFVIEGNKEYDVSSLLPPDFFEMLKYDLAGTCLVPQWSEKQKQVWALFRVLSGKNKYLLKITSDTSCMIKGEFRTDWKDQNSDRIILFSHVLIFDKKALEVLIHELNHVLHHQLGLSGEPALCSYKTKFIRDVYQIISKEGVPIPLKDHTVRSVVTQCPEVACDWDHIEEAWNMLGFIEIDGTVYINEFSDVALPYDAKPSKDAEAIEFCYHAPMILVPYFLADPKHFFTWRGRQNYMIEKDYRMGQWENFDNEDKNNAQGSRYLETISVALNVPPFDNFSQGRIRRKGLDVSKFIMECIWLQYELKEADGFFKKSDPKNPDFDEVLP